MLSWFATGHRRCSRAAREVIEDGRTLVHVSAATLWEIATKQRLGKWPEASSMIANYQDVMIRYAFDPLPIGVEHARIAGALAEEHKDPFDRMLAAQAQIEGMILITADPAFKIFGTRKLR